MITYQSKVGNNYLRALYFIIAGQLIAALFHLIIYITADINKQVWTIYLCMFVIMLLELQKGKRTAYLIAGGLFISRINAHRSIDISMELKEVIIYSKLQYSLFYPPYQVVFIDEKGKLHANPENPEELEKQLIAVNPDLKITHR
ncbi:hypothetical protein [uncultured Bacteroides sp.]|uniref:hypothetical protein n=1 Tax=uncultured Bacteroides sp. TaxID=162156 RepID=UPI00261F7791|nr:hypothetical protein [uncultured Bacteroides sp.]